jgi:hypothetical protein
MDDVVELAEIAVVPNVDVAKGDRLFRSNISFLLGRIVGDNVSTSRLALPGIRSSDLCLLAINLACPPLTGQGAALLLARVPTIEQLIATDPSAGTAGRGA